MTFKFLNKMTFLLLVTSLLMNSFIFSMSNQKEGLKSTTSKQTTEISFQKIDCQEMNLLNKLLLLKPMYALRLKSTYLNAREIINYFEPKESNSQENSTKSIAATTDEKNKVLEFRDKILKPVSTFFTQLHSTQGLLGGLINAIFKQTKFATTDEDLSKTLMLQFFLVDKKTAQTFFNDALVTKEMLLKACKEFEILFGVVDASLSPEVKKAAEEEEKRVITDFKNKLTNQKNQDPKTQNTSNKK